MGRKKWPLTVTEATRWVAKWNGMDVKTVRTLATGNLTFELAEEWQEFENLSIYEDPLYIFDVLRGYELTTRRSCTVIRREFINQNIQVKSILDYGAGFGVSTALLAAIFPNAEVTFYDPSEELSIFARWLADQMELKNWKELDGPVGTPDMIVCLEVLEHIKEPFKTLRTFEGSEYIVVSTDFNSPQWVGHYKEYIVDGLVVPGRHMTKLLRKELAFMGYEPTEETVSHWNGKPKIWKLHRRDV
jgi:SAM-dependent methyltransferase